MLPACCLIGRASSNRIGFRRKITPVYGQCYCFTVDDRDENFSSFVSIVVEIYQSDTSAKIREKKEEWNLITPLSNESTSFNFENFNTR